MLGVAWSLSTLVACQEAPHPGLAADPGKAAAPGPWGSSTSNEELERKRAILTDVLDGKLTAEALPARLAKEFPQLSDDDRKKSVAAVAELMSTLQRTGQLGQVVSSSNDRMFAMAQLEFGDRRFIEAATLLSQVLDTQPTYPRARNMLARCFFFLGNRDRTLAELQVLLESDLAKNDKQEVLDALFLMGAAVLETPGMSRDNLQRGLGAWQTYMKLVPDLPAAQAKQMNEGIATMEAGLRGEGALAQPTVPVAQQGDGGGGGGADSKGVLGGSKGAPAGSADSTGGPNTGGPAGNRSARVASLSASATPTERALAEGLDALDAKQLDVAEAELQKVLAVEARSAAALTGMGRVRVQQGRYDEALRSFGEAIKVDSGYMPAWHYNGMAHMMAGAPAEAVRSWEKIRTANPAYFAEFNLDKRIEVAKRMAGQ
jgi:tetratricopeptide (TPR) repeat protein